MNTTLNQRESKIHNDIKELVHRGYPGNVDDLYRYVVVSERMAAEAMREACAKRLELMSDEVMTALPDAHGGSFAKQFARSVCLGLSAQICALTWPLT